MPSPPALQWIEAQAEEGWGWLPGKAAWGPVEAGAGGAGRAGREAEEKLVAAVQAGDWAAAEALLDAGASPLALAGGAGGALSAVQVASQSRSEGLLLLLLHRAALAAPLGPHGDLELRAACTLHLAAPAALGAISPAALGAISPAALTPGGRSRPAPPRPAPPRPAGGRNRRG